MVNIKQKSTLFGGIAGVSLFGQIGKERYFYSSDLCSTILYTFPGQVLLCKRREISSQFTFLLSDMKAEKDTGRQLKVRKLSKETTFLPVI